MLNWSNYAIEADLKGATGVDMPNLAAKSDLASLKAEVDIYRWTKNCSSWFK